MRIRIAIVDSHESSHIGLKQQFNTIEDFLIVLKAYTGPQFLELLKTTIPDLVLMEMTLSEMNGMEVTDKVKELYPNLKIIIYANYTNDNVVQMNIRGVKSFIGKNEHPNELIKAIRIVNSGGVYMTDAAAEIVQKHLANGYQKPCPFNVNEFELKLLKNLCEGLSSTEISKVIYKSPRTVEKYREDLYKKFEVNSKEELISFVVKWKLV
jgi:DNA-binding NarL/FixJ family response regulator